MIPHLLFYQLAVLGLLWLCVMLHAAWPSRCMTAQGTSAPPIIRRRQRSKEPKPFAGLTHKPSCALCEPETAHPQLRPPVRPDPMPPTHRRPREIDTSRHFCHHDGGDYRGWLGLGNLRANGHPSGGPWRQFHCTACEGYVLETHGTLFHGKRTSVERIVHVLACLAEDFLPFVNPHLSHFLSHLHDRLTANPACIIARTLTQHGAPGVIAGKCTVSVLSPSPQNHMSETIATPSGLMCPW